MKSWKQSNIIVFGLRKLFWEHKAELILRGKWNGGIASTLYATGYQREMLNAGSIIIKEMNSLVIGRLLLTGPCLHKSGQGAVQCSSPYNHYWSGSSGIRIRFTEGFIFKTCTTTGGYYWHACQSQHKGRLRMLHISSLSISALGYFLWILTIDGGCCKQSLHFDTGSFSVNIDDPANLRHLQTGMLQAEP